MFDSALAGTSLGQLSLTEIGVLVFIAVYFFSGLALMFCIQKPVNLLIASEPDEYRHAIGDAFSIMTWKAIPFAYYLASGNYAKRIQSQQIVEQLKVSMWVARVQLFCLAAFCICLFSR